MKKFLVFLLIAIVVGLGFLPPVTTKMGEGAFKTPDSPAAQDSLKDAIQLKMYMFMFPEARKFAERAIIWFPESKYIDIYVFDAALCAEKENLPAVAAHWYGRFVEIFPDHPWTRQAAARLEKIKALNDLK